MIWSALLYDFGQHARRIDARESRPHSLDVMGVEGRSAMEWTLETLRQFGITQVLYLGDYHIEKVISRFPELKVQYVAGIKDEIGFEMVERYLPNDSSVILINASTILLPGALEKLLTTVPAYGVDARGRSLGVYPLTMACLRDLRQKRPASLSAYFEAATLESANLDGLAASVTDQEAVARTIFRGKAQTLDNLAPLVKDAVFLPRERVTITEWQQDREVVLARIERTFAPVKLVVRSSVVGEDGLHKSFAGQYLSLLDVASDQPHVLAAAMDQVVESYRSQERDLQGDDEVLIQPQVTDVLSSGVLLTRDTRAGGPYFLLNEDRNSGRSDSVTAGDTNAISQRYIAWSATEAPALEEEIRRLLKIARQLMRLSCLDALDIEYIIDRQGRVYILQVRPLGAARDKAESADADLLDMLAGAAAFVGAQMQPQHGLLGDSTVFGVMPDWNPAEMIGLSPRPLALSLYQKLVGESAWAEARARLGYRDARPEPLILSLGGRPFVDLRASLNSLLPASLDDSVAERWVNHCLAMVRSDRTLHDKIEFDVAITCLAPDWPIVRERFVQAGIDPEAFREPLRHLTQSILAEQVEPIDAQFTNLTLMARRRERLLAETEPTPFTLCRRLAYLLQDCQSLGLVSFATLARYAFIGMNFLKGFVNVGIISQSQYDEYLLALPTVASDIAHDLHADLPIEELVARYGHLRPNSYEITAPNYASDPERYLRQDAASGRLDRSSAPAEILLTNRVALERCCANLGLDVSTEVLVDFISRSIVGRERGKFEFMKSVNAILETAALLGDHLGLTREQVSFLSITDLLNLRTQSVVVADQAQLGRRAAYNEKRWRVTRAMHLPDVIVGADDVHSFTLESWRANFITHKKALGPLVWITETPEADLTGAIVAIRAADPGHDWIFAHPIAGLITEFGGVASHMSIRAAEFGLPAAIGCGSVVFDSLQGAQLVELDASSEKIRVLK